jgi:hypothetical protein
MATIEERVSRLEGSEAQMTERLNDVIVELRELRRSIETRTWWMIGLMMTMWVTIILAIVFSP